MSSSPILHLQDPCRAKFLLPARGIAGRAIDRLCFASSLGLLFAFVEDVNSCLSRGGFRRVQHVRPNRGPTKTGSPQKDNFFIFWQHGNKPEILKYVGPSHFFLNRGPAWSKSGPVFTHSRTGKVGRLILSDLQRAARLSRRSVAGNRLASGQHRTRSEVWCNVMQCNVM